jgi:autotransporter-associated beta strand protein
MILASNYDTSTQKYATVNFTTDTFKTFVLGGSNNQVIFEGATVDNYQTTLTAIDPTADRTISLPDATGTVALTSGTTTFTGDKTFTGDILIDDGSVTLFRNMNTDQTYIGSINYNNTFMTGADDRAVILQALTDGGTSGNRGGQLKIYTKAASSGNNIVALTINNTQDTTFAGYVKATTYFAGTSEDLANSGAADLTKTLSYFTTAAGETATLLAGTEGQIKMFSFVTTDAGSMVITVTNAGWKASGTGTITFDDIGDGCTLMYANSKWCVVGNNGGAFA